MNNNTFKQVLFVNKARFPTKAFNKCMTKALYGFAKISDIDDAYNEPNNFARFRDFVACYEEKGNRLQITIYKNKQIGL